MALIIDLDDLSQGNSNAVGDLAFTASAAAVTTMTGATTLPVITAGDFFEIRDSSNPVNNGLYEETGGSPTTSSVTATKVVGPDPANLSAEATTWLGDNATAATFKSVHFDTPTLTIYLLEQGNLSTDGVTMLAFHSFAKEAWKSDNFLIAAAGFPIVGISFAAGQWEFGKDPSGNNNGWKLAEDDASPVIKTRRLIRNAGWNEIDANGNTLRKYANITTLPTTSAFEDPLDLAYYRFGTDATDTSAAVDFEFAGEVNEPVKFFQEFGNPDTCDFATSSTITRASGSFITDGYQIGSQVTVRNSAVGDHNGTFVLTAVVALTLTVTGTPFTTGTDTAAQLAVDNDNVFKTFLRIRDADPSGKLFAAADLAAAGETVLDSKIIKMGLANATDNDIDVTDGGISATPYSEIRLRYLPADFNRAVDSATLRAYGIVADVGTYSRSNGVTAGSTLITSADHVLGVGEALADYTGGTITMHDATAPDRAVHTIVGTPVDNAGTLEVTVSSGLTNSESSMSFTIQRATPINASKQQIYEKIHFQLRQASDIDETQNTVVGKIADDFAVFSGANLQLGEAQPTNPNGGGSGVIIEGFDANDTNNLFFFDNGAVSRNFPFVAAGNINVNQGLVDDTDGEVWLFYEYTRRTTGATVDVVGPSGDTYDLESDASQLGTYIVNDYLLIAGFAQSENNGLFIVTVVNTSQSDYTVRKVNGTAVGTVETDQTVSVDENPYPSPQGIIVDDNSGSDIAFNVGGLSTAFDYDYESNVQGGRTADSDAAVVLVGSGLETGQFAVASGLTITKATGLSFTLTSPLERNYSNP